MKFKNTDTPCIGVCSTVYGDDVCRGCHRFATEVIEWNTYQTEQKSVILSRLNEISSEISAKYLKVTDKELLQHQCKSLGIRFRLEFHPVTWAYMLIKMRPDRIEAPELYGFKVNSDFAHLNMRQLLELIDTEIFKKSLQVLQSE
jgi:predicted Fe-S protein YdhL (DUF1289 family)